MSARILFYDDYSEGAHPAILEALATANGGQEDGYGLDSHSQLAARRIAAEMATDCAVHLVSGGTQANLLCLGALLRPHQGVIAADTAHINVHETGAVEATGHRVMAVASADGRLTPALLEQGINQHQDEHTVKPGAVFVSQATEVGTVYSTAQLTALVERAHAHSLPVYLDGARLATALAATGERLADIAQTGVDILYLGGTKNGALCGEAIVIRNMALAEDFRYHIKQRGALLAKGRLLGSQFARFFADDMLWYRLGADANAAAARLAAGLMEVGVALALPREANQVFCVIDDRRVAALAPDFGFHIWQRRDESHVVVRLVCSWATRDVDTDALLSRLRALSQTS